MNYTEAIDWIHSREKFKIKPGLKRMQWMLEQLGHPEKKLRAIHVAGTNGKGSTVSFLRNLLQKQGYSIGTFTSPYIVKFNERMSIDGEAIADYELAMLADKVKPLVEKLRGSEIGEPTEFETITVMAFLYFADKAVDFTIVETGLGGRYDSTNVITPILSIITNIGKDHMSILGNTYEKIAFEKAGIIKPEVPVLTAVTQAEALSVIKKEAEQNNSLLFLYQKHFKSEHIASTHRGEEFKFQMADYVSPSMTSPLKGLHQVNNASLALAAAELLIDQGFLIQRTFYPEGIGSTFWPARFETIKREPVVIIDGAHNEEGTEALANTLKQHYNGRTIYLLYAALADKPAGKMLNQLKPVVKEAWVTQFDFPRVLPAKELGDQSPIEPTYVESNCQAAVERILKKMSKEDVLVISGSLYFISEIRKNFE
ncbi:folylpolyglutamate synthase/dihydrofolate synthase family protein [Halobacillus sp. Marseille-Q1614]|uniref:bifunctional folylpolyglutamate synthase/dihydrofolate synthase n=1 Tax=Halobacillus sp. Marseille-Q1614 TaxID=2709134 RepID=UPI00156EB893|nr:folylpolyglutamate synthase/dihydrofolate synthase family protein [Halobacillus sp. Marseille-Q1614]